MSSRSNLERTLDFLLSSDKKNEGRLPDHPVLAITRSMRRWFLPQLGKIPSRKRQDRSAFERIQSVAERDVTEYGEHLGSLDFDPEAPGVDDYARSDYERVLEAYDEAKLALRKARYPADFMAVTQALEGGRFRLACLAARREGHPLPERRAPCYFDPTHGPSVGYVDWGMRHRRKVPVCATDEANVAAGIHPRIRTVPVGDGQVPYWDAGPEYRVWAAGYYSSYGELFADFRDVVATRIERAADHAMDELGEPDWNDRHSYDSFMHRPNGGPLR